MRRGCERARREPPLLHLRLLSVDCSLERRTPSARLLGAFFVFSFASSRSAVRRSPGAPYAACKAAAVVQAREPAKSLLHWRLRSTLTRWATARLLLRRRHFDCVCFRWGCFAHIEGRFGAHHCSLLQVRAHGHSRQMKTPPVAQAAIPCIANPTCDHFARALASVLNHDGCTLQPRRPPHLWGEQKLANQTVGGVQRPARASVEAAHSACTGPRH